MRTARTLWRLVRLAFQADPWRAALGTVFGVITNAFDPVIALGLKMIADAAVEQDVGQVLWTTAFVVGALVVLIVTGWTGFHIDTVLQEKLGVRIDERLIAITSSIPTLEHHERPDYHDEVELLRSETQALANVHRALVQNLGTAVRVASTAILLARLHPVLLLLPLFAVPSLATSAVAERIRQRAREAGAERIRLARHLFDTATTAGPGKELRLFQLAPRIVSEHEDVWRQTDQLLNRAAVRGGALVTAGWAFFAVGYVAAIVFVVRRAVAGQATPGDVLLALTLASSINAQVQASVMMLLWLLRSLVVVRRLGWLEQHAEDHTLPPSDPAPVPGRIRDAIKLEGVTFRYPGTETDILRDVDLTLPSGSTVAVVGDNGAGKTTLMKLLGRFYDPTSGRITLDGVDISRFPVEVWRTRMSAGFQDFARFEFTAQLAVGVGDLPMSEDGEVVSGALDRAGAGDVAAGLPSGLATQLGRTFADGVELSGGQWQKLALGRAMMRPSPLLLVLDEPTASLDAETEHALFERYARAAGDVGRETGAVTILVSHRFSTVRMADLIVVIDGGRVVEAGPHDELVGRGGLYAELYELQARGYR